MKKKLIILFVISLILLLKNDYLYSSITVLNDWEQVKVDALKKNKSILLFCTNNRCIWCLKMESETLSDSTVSKMLDEHFITYKVNCNDSIGKLIAKKYRILGFPTCLISNSLGKLISKNVGFQKPNKFINTLQSILADTVSTKYKGISDSLSLDFPFFYNDYFNYKDYPTQPDSFLVHWYLENQTNLFSEVNWSVISQFDLNEHYNEFFLENYQKYKELYGATDAGSKLFDIINKIFEEAVKTKDTNCFDKISKLMDIRISTNLDLRRLFYHINFCLRTDNIKAVRIDLLKIFADDNWDQVFFIGEIDRFTQKLLNFNFDDSFLKEAIKFYKKVDLNNADYSTIFTFSELLFYDKQFKEARKVALIAETQGKKERRPIKELMALLTRINEQIEKE